MNNESNVNTTQNPNVTSPSVSNTPLTPSGVSTPTAPVSSVASVASTVSSTTPVAIQGTSSENNNVQTIVVSSNYPEDDSANVSTPAVNMPTIVNPLEVKVEEYENKPKKVVTEKKVLDDQPKEKGPSEYALKLQQAIDNYKPPSKFKTALTIIMIIFIILFGTFMPEIYNYVAFLKAGGNQPLPQEPTTGVLTCELETVTSQLDKTFTRKFSYEDNKLKSAVIETNTRGDITLDEEILDEMYSKCDLISKSVEGIPGITVKCEYTDGLLVERERFDYQNYDIELINAAYVEAGSTLLEFDYDADIDEIKKGMLQAGFTCNKDVK